MNRSGLRAPARRLAAALMGAGIALVGATGASASTSPFAQYKASASPASVTAGAGTFTVTLTDCGIVAGVPACSGLTPSFDTMHSATITLGDAPASATVSPATWTAAVSGNTITLSSSSSGSDLSFGQSVAVTIPSPRAAGLDSIRTAAFDTGGLQFNEIGSDPSVNVGPGAVASLSVTQQPTEVVIKTAIAPAVKVHAADAFGNSVPNAPISMTLAANSAGGTLGGTLTQPTDPNGNATFPDLSIDTAGFGYALGASSGTANVTSNSFTVASALTVCGASCLGTATDTAGTTSTTANVTGESSGSDLFITMYSPTTYAPPANACGSVAAAGSGSQIDLNGNATIQATNRTLTWRLDKSIVNSVSNNGASKYLICMGAVNLVNPAQSWTTKGGTQALPESDGKFWGVLPLCASLANPSSQPCINSQNKTNAGDVVISISVPAPWDEALIGGLPRVGV